MAPRQRRMVDPDYAGQIQGHIAGHVTGNRPSSSGFQTPVGGGISNRQKKDLLFPKNGPSATAARVNEVSNIFTDFVGIGSKNGKFQADPVALALNFAPWGKLGKLGRIGEAAGSVLKRATPAALRFDTAAANVVGRAARNARAARIALEDAAWQRGLAEDSLAGAHRLDPILRTETNMYSHLGHGAFDEDLGSVLTHTAIGGSTPLRDAEALVRSGEAGVRYTSRGTKVYDNLRRGRLIEEATAARNTALNRASTAADDLARSERITEYYGNSGVKEILKRRVRAVQQVRAAIRRNPSLGAKKPPTPEVW